MHPKTTMNRFRRLQAIFGRDYHGGRAQPIEGGYIFELRIRRHIITVFLADK